MSILALTIIRPVASSSRSFSAFRGCNVSRYRFFHTTTVSQWEQHRQSLDRSRQQPEPDESKREAAEEDAGPNAASGGAMGKLDTPSPLHGAATQTSHPHEKYDLDSNSPTQSSERLTPPNFNVIKQRLREWSEQTSVVIRTRADDFTALSKTTFSQLGTHLNQVTGYEEIEALKKRVVDQEQSLNATRRASREAKKVYQQAVIQRSNSQREVNELLQRKSLWTDMDVGRFTTLVRQDHLYEQEEQRAKAAVEETEDAVEREFSQLMRIILARYHEEQVWSDKIRSVSTYGSLTVLGLNLFVFILAILVVEPWKRRNLSKTFEKKIQELSMENAAKLDASMQEIGGYLAQQEHLLEEMKDQLSVKLNKLEEIEREADSRRETKLESVSDTRSAVKSRRDLALVSASIGAGVCIAALWDWFR